MLEFVFKDHDFVQGLIEFQQLSELISLVLILQVAAVFQQQVT